MQFTKQEAKLVDDLRKEERRWPRARWIYFTLVFGSVLLACGWGYMFHQAFTVFSQLPTIDTGGVFVLVFLWTKCCLWIFLGVVFLWKTAFNWRGNVTRMLLLKLLDEAQKPNAAD